MNGGGAQPPTESFQSRDWNRTLNVGQSVWEFKEQPDVYGTLDPGLPGKQVLYGHKVVFILRNFLIANFIMSREILMMSSDD